MASRWAIRTTILALMLAACAPPVQTSIKERRTGGSSSRAAATAKPGASVAPVSLTVKIEGPTPEAVALHGTKAALAPSAYVLLQAQARFVPVPQAEVTVTDPQGRQLAGKALRTDASGAVKLPRIVSKAELVFVRAAYLIRGQRVSLAAAVPTPRGDGSATVDPATTLIAKKLEMLGRMNIVDVGVVPADMPGKLAGALATRLTEEEIAAIGLLDPEPAARMLDARLARDTGLRDAFTASVGPGGALTAFLQPLPRTAASAAPGGNNGAGTRTPRPGEIDAVATTLPDDPSFSLPPLTPEPTQTPSPLAVSAPPSVAPSRSPSPSPSASTSAAASVAPSASASATTTP